jgi:hypothetical protein
MYFFFTIFIVYSLYIILKRIFETTIHNIRQNIFTSDSQPCLHCGISEFLEDSDDEVDEDNLNTEAEAEDVDTEAEDTEAVDTEAVDTEAEAVDEDMTNTETSDLTETGPNLTQISNDKSDYAEDVDTDTEVETDSDIITKKNK